MIKVDILAGSSIEDALQLLKEEARNQHCLCFCEFNGKELYSTDTIDEAYIKVTGSNKAEAERKRKEWLDEYNRREAEHKSRIPDLTEEYRKKARGLVLDERLEFWDKVVPIRLGDIYHGMELQQTLDICAIMRDDTLTYDERLRKAYKCFMDAGHSGMSAHLTASMIVSFCPDGADVADAVMNFRFDKDGK